MMIQSKDQNASLIQETIYYTPLGCWLPVRRTRAVVFEVICFIKYKLLTGHGMSLSINSSSALSSGLGLPLISESAVLVLTYI